MKILITGSQGYIGSYLYSNIKKVYKNVVGLDKSSGADQVIDVTTDKFEEFLFNYQPDIIIHTAAAKDLKYCEENRFNAWNINVGPAVKIINYIKLNPSAKIIYISSDVVFDGLKGNYKPSDEPNPINWYGSTKLQNELIFKMVSKSTILRTALVYGDLTQNYKDILANELNNEILLNQSLLPHYVYNRLSTDKLVKLPDMVISSPTHLETIAQGILNVLKYNLSGTYHLAGSEIISRYDFALKIAKFHNLNKSLVQKDENTILSFRPKNIGLDVKESYKTLKLKEQDWTVDAVLGKIKWELI